MRTTSPQYCFEGSRVNAQGRLRRNIRSQWPSYHWDRSCSCRFQRIRDGSCIDTHARKTGRSRRECAGSCRGCYSNWAGWTLPRQRSGGSAAAPADTEGSARIYSSRQHGICTDILQVLGCANWDSFPTISGDRNGESFILASSRWRWPGWIGAIFATGTGRSGKGSSRTPWRKQFAARWRWQPRSGCCQ